MSTPVIVLESRGGFCEFLAANVDLKLWMVDYDVIKGAIDPEKDDASDLARTDFKRGSSYLLKRAFDRLEKLSWVQNADFGEAGLGEDMFMPVIASDPVEITAVVEKGMVHAEAMRPDVQVVLVDHDERTISACEVAGHTPTGMAEARHLHLTAIREAFDALAPTPTGPAR